MSDLVEQSLDGLTRLVAQLPAGEDRPGQREMCEAVARAFDTGDHLFVEAGTGTGKSLAYLVPALLHEDRVVVVTATKALQDQLVRKDVPFVTEHLDLDVDAAVLKGRSNYLCLARLAEAEEAGPHDRQLKLVRSNVVQETIPAIAQWAETGEGGERHDLPVEVSALVWDALTIGPRECPGARGCPHVDGCFAERAREHAQVADLVIVNAHLYCLDLAIGGGLLGEHGAVIVDEAHTLEEIASSVFGLSLGPGRFTWLANQLKGILVSDAKEVEATERLARAFGRALDSLGAGRVEPGEGPLGNALTTAGEVLAGVASTLRGLEVPEAEGVRRARALQAASGLADEIRSAQSPPPGSVSWIEEGEGISLRVAPVDVGPVLDEKLFSPRTVIATSATLSVGGEVDPTARALGLRDGGWRGMRLDSPFDYRRHALLYCPAHLPDPRNEHWLDGALDELAALIEAAQGRTLALFTSYRVMHAAADALGDRWEWPVLVQEQASRSQLLEQFRSDEQSCLFATLSFWQGVDIPGDSVRVVALDKLPFARPDEPLLQARREAAEAAGNSGFETVDLARAARLLAQGAGRLIRSSTDRGVVAVLDPRLAKARYRGAILESLPPLRRSVDRDEAVAFLESLRA